MRQETIAICLAADEVTDLEDECVQRFDQIYANYGKPGVDIQPYQTVFLECCARRDEARARLNSLISRY